MVSIPAHTGTGLLYHLANQNLPVCQLTELPTVSLADDTAPNPSKSTKSRAITLAVGLTTAACGAGTAGPAGIA